MTSPDNRPKGDRPRAGSGAAGFTLLEVMIALVVLSLGLTASFKLQAQDLSVVDRADKITRACLAAENITARWQAFGRPALGRDKGREGDGGLNYTVETSADPDWPEVVLVRLTVTGTDQEPWLFERRYAAAEKAEGDQ